MSIKHTKLSRLLFGHAPDWKNQSIRIFYSVKYVVTQVKSVYSLGLRDDILQTNRIKMYYYYYNQNANYECVLTQSYSAYELNSKRQISQRYVLYAIMISFWFSLFERMLRPEDTGKIINVFLLSVSRETRIERFF